MDFLQLVKERYSVRKFDSRLVEKEKLDRILEAGRVAPTAVNFQPQRILVMESGEALEKLKLCTPFHFDAPLALLVCYDKNVSWKDRAGRDIGGVDASIVTTQMMYAALEQGLGSTWVGVFDIEALRENFNIPDYLNPVAILPLGYPAADAAPNPKMHFSRYDISHSVFYNTFEGIEEGENNAGKH